MTTKEPLTFGTRHYDCSINYAAICCGHVHWRQRLFRAEYIAGQLVSKSVTCPFCNNLLVFGEWAGELNGSDCGYKHLGEILAQFNRPCKVIKTKKHFLNEVGKVWLVRIFKYANGIDADYYVVPHDHPKMSGCVTHFSGERDFIEYMKLITENEFDCYFSSQRFDL